MVDYPYFDVTWRVAQSGNRTVIQSSPIADKSKLHEIKCWIDGRFREEIRVDLLGNREPFEAYEVDVARSGHRVGIEEHPGEPGARLEVRNTSPEQFQQIIGATVAEAQKWSNRVIVMPGNPGATL